MIYYINEYIEKKMEKNAGSKARDDVEKIFQNFDMQTIQVCRKEHTKGIKMHLNHAAAIYYSLKKEDIQNSLIFFQFPLIGHSVFNSMVLKKIKRKRNKIVGIIHDLEFLRFNEYTDTIGYKRIKFEEFSLLNVCDKIIVHNAAMRELLICHGIDEDKMIELEIFDYLIDINAQKKITKEFDADVAIAGNLKAEKSGYVYKLPDKPRFALYGANFCEKSIQKNVKYRGSFYPDELVLQLNERYGLIWDGNSVNSCEGNYGQYLKYNNPHKTSLYLAGELPVIIWEQAALAPFVLKHKVGIVIKNLNEISKKIEEISADEYMEIKENVVEISGKIRSGYFMSCAIKKAIGQLGYKG